MAQLHHLPCHFNLDGPAKVSTFFLPELSEDGSLVAHLRGRQLAGRSLHLPAGVQGLVLRELEGSELLSSASSRRQALASVLGKVVYGGRPEEGGVACSGEDAEDFDGLFGGGGMEDSDSGGEGGGGGRGSSGGAASPSPAAASGSSATPSASAGQAPAKAWVVDAAFTRITSWHHDTPATDQDMLPRALEWMRLLATLHNQD